jgi:propionate CoA-transferase
MLATNKSRAFEERPNKDGLVHEVAGRRCVGWLESQLTRPQSSNIREASVSSPIIPTARSGKTGKIVTAREAARLVRSGDTVAIGGFFGIGLAMEVVHELAAIYEASDAEAASFGKPRDLTLVWCVSPGDGQQRGAQRLAQPGLVKRMIGGHWIAVPALYQLVAGNQVEGYNLPLGPMSHLYRDIAAGKPGHLSRVGLGTFADPRFGGGKLNERTT